MSQMRYLPGRMDVIAADGPAMKTIPNVPIVSTGTYSLAGNPYPGGETTFTEDDLADAVQAVNDPAIKLPRLKLGHASEWGDAEPAFGRVDNLRIGDNGQTIYGDFVGVPAWFADVLPVAYPNRSIEANFGVKTPTGNEYRMVIYNLALLGVQLPGVATLEDLSGLYTETAPEGMEVESESTVTATIGEDVRLLGRKREAKASTNIEDVRRAFYDEVAIGDQYYWWIREVYLDPNELVVDDGDSTLYRMSFEVNDEEVSFGEAEEVKIQYVAAGDGADAVVVGSTYKAPEVPAATVFASRSESRPENQQQEEPSMDKIREKLGLPADATEDDVLEKMAENEGTPSPQDPAAVPPSTQPPGQSEGNPAEQGPETGTPSPEGEPTPTPAPDPAAEPAGAVAGQTVDPETLAQLQRDAQAGREARAAQLDQEREDYLTRAVKAGKFPPSRVEHYRNLWNADREGAIATIDNLAEGLVPVTETGEAGTEAELQAAQGYPESWLSPSERRRIDAARSGETPLVTDERKVTV